MSVEITLTYHLLDELSKLKCIINSYELRDRSKWCEDFFIFFEIKSAHIDM